MLKSLLKPQYVKITNISFFSHVLHNSYCTTSSATSIGNTKVSSQQKFPPISIIYETKKKIGEPKTRKKPLTEVMGQLISEQLLNDEATDETLNEAKIQIKKRPRLIRKALIEELKMDKSIVNKFTDSCPNILEQNIENIKRNAAHLTEAGIIVQTILDNPHIMLHNEKAMQVKLDMLKLMKPRNINDFAPFLKISVSKLHKIVKITQKEKSYVKGGHRVYLLSDKLKVSPQIISKYYTTHMFMFKLNYDMLCDNLDILVKYIAPENIVRDMCAFRYSTHVIESRLQRAQEGQKDKLMPWMIRCQDQVLEKSISLTLAQKKLLGKDSLANYLSERLKFDIVTTKFILDKHPQVYTCRVTKVKEVLDYLLNEAGYTAHDIAQVPRVLCHSLDTTKNRLTELQLYGCRPNSLVTVCKSKNEYNKFLDEWKAVGERINDKNDTLAAA